MCAGNLKNVNYEADIMVDECPMCKGIWLDTGELEKIQTNAQKNHKEKYYNHMIAIKTKLNKFLKKNALLKFNLFPLFPITKKPNETRMGKGVGSIDNYIYIVRTGYTLCEIYTNSAIDISKILKLVKQRLNLKTKIIRLV
jgi:ribosomal protein L16/L10AE